MACLLPLLSLAETSNIVMVDASGSMAGMGGVIMSSQRLESK